MEFTNMTDAEVNALHRDVTAEQQRRAALAGIPQQIAELATEYREKGGDESALIDALTPEQQAALDASAYSPLVREDGEGPARVGL